VIEQDLIDLLADRRRLADALWSRLFHGGSGVRDDLAGW
jgi:hypothetical protein